MFSNAECAKHVNESTSALDLNTVRPSDALTCGPVNFDPHPACGTMRFLTNHSLVSHPLIVGKSSLRTALHPL